MGIPLETEITVDAVSAVVRAAEPISSRELAGVAMVTPVGALGAGFTTLHNAVRGTETRAACQLHPGGPDFVYGGCQLNPTLRSAGMEELLATLDCPGPGRIARCREAFRQTGSQPLEWPIWESRPVPDGARLQK